MNEIIGYIWIAIDLVALIWLSKDLYKLLFKTL